MPRVFDGEPTHQEGHLTMAKRRKKPKKKCPGRKANGQLKKGWKNVKNRSCPIPAKKKRR